MGLSAAPPAVIDAALLPSGRGRMAWQATAAEGVIPYLTHAGPVDGRRTDLAAINGQNFPVNHTEGP
jgi:hypothetical protein